MGSTSKKLEGKSRDRAVDHAGSQKSQIRMKDENNK